MAYWNMQLSENRPQQIRHQQTDLAIVNLFVGGFYHPTQYPCLAKVIVDHKEENLLYVFKGSGTPWCQK